MHGFGPTRLRRGRLERTRPWDGLAARGPNRPTVRNGRRIGLARLTGTALLSTLATTTSSAIAKDYAWEKDADHRYRLWIPEDVATLRGVLVHFNGTGDDDRALVDEPTFFEPFVRAMDLAFIGTYLEPPPRATDLAEALVALAEVSGRPELIHAPLLLEGISLGGYAALEFAQVHPGRTVAFVCAATRRFPPLGTDERYAGVPGLMFIGSLETDANVAKFEKGAHELRARGHRVGYFRQANVGHKWGHGLYVGRAFLAAVFARRVRPDADARSGPVPLEEIPEEEGWLVQHAEDDLARIAPARDFVGDRTSHGWVPTEALAVALRSAWATRELVHFEGNPNDTWSPRIVGRGETIPLELHVDSESGDVRTVRMFDGAREIATLTRPPWQVRWTARKSGFPIFSAVAEDRTGRRTSGRPLGVLVRGRVFPPDPARDDAHESNEPTPTHGVPRGFAAATLGAFAALLGLGGWLWLRTRKA